MKNRECCVSRATALVFIMVPVAVMGQAQSDRPVDFTPPPGVSALYAKLGLQNPEDALRGEMQNDLTHTRDFYRTFLAQAKKVLEGGPIPDDTVFQVILFNTAGIGAIALEQWADAERYLTRADTLVTTGRINLRPLQADVRWNLLVSFLMQKEFMKAVPLARSIIEDDQGVGTGGLANALSSGTVSRYVSAAQAAGIPVTEVRAYLESTSEKYDNEVACAADVQLFILALREADRPRAEALKSRILTRYPSSRQFTELYRSVITQ